MNRYRVVVAGALVFGIGVPVSAQTANSHPNPAFVDQTIPPSFRVAIDGAEVPGLLRFGAPLARIGQEDAGDEFLFGSIADVAVTRRREYVIVDRAMHDVRVFDARGRFLQRLGRAGAGPGEFRAPRAVLVTPTDELWVFDLQRRIAVYERAAGAYRFQRQIATPMAPSSTCRIGGRVFANAASAEDAHLVRELTEAGQVERAFGAVYRSPNPGLNYQLSEGLVACDPTHGVVAFASSAPIGEVRGYSTEGALLWRTRIDGLRHNRITDRPGGGTAVERSAEGAHALVGFAHLPDLGFVVQYGFRTPAEMEARAPAGQVRTLLIDGRSGRPSITDFGGQRIVRGDTAAVLLVSEDPIPRLEVRARRR